MGISQTKLKAALEKTARPILARGCPIGNDNCRTNMEMVKATLGQEISTCACCYADWLILQSQED